MTVIHQDLLEQLTQLGNCYPELGNRLLQQAQLFQQKGSPLPENLVQEILTYQQQFRQLQQQITTLIPPPSSTAISSLIDLQNLVKNAQEKVSLSPVHEKALQILNRVLAIKHREQLDFSPLQLVHRKAQDLQQVLGKITDNSSHPDAEALVAKTHPVSAVLSLIEDRENLDDEQWMTLEETVSASFGKTLTVAISRGKLEVSSGGDVENTPRQSPTPIVSNLPPSSSALSEVIIIPSGGGSSENNPAKNDPDIRILQSPPPQQPLHEVIIVPSTEIPSRSSGSANVVANVGNNPSPVNFNQVGLEVVVNLQGVGERSFSAQEYAGTRGESRRLEGFLLKINPPIPGLSLRYMAHISGSGDTPWFNEGELVGSRGQGKRIEGFAVQLIGPESAKYDVFYNAHIQNVGDTPALSNGQYCGTKGRSLRVEGMRVWVKSKS